MSEWVHQFLPASGNAATVLLLHETGANENDLIPIGRAVARGSALLSPRLQQSDETAVRAQELAGFVTQAVERYGLDRSKLFALGYSSGADLAAALLVLHPGLFTGAILLRGRLQVQTVTPPLLDGATVLMLAGQHDRIAKPEDTEFMARTLTEAGATVEVHWMNEGHELGPEDFQRAAKWMRARIATLG